MIIWDLCHVSILYSQGGTSTLLRILSFVDLPVDTATGIGIMRERLGERLNRFPPNCTSVGIGKSNAIYEE